MPLAEIHGGLSRWLVCQACSNQKQAQCMPTSHLWRPGMALWLVLETRKACWEDGDERRVADVIVQRLQALAAADPGQPARRQASGPQHVLASQDSEMCPPEDGNIHHWCSMVLPVALCSFSLCGA